MLIDLTGESYVVCLSKKLLNLEAALFAEAVAGEGEEEPRGLYGEEEGEEEGEAARRLSTECTPSLCPPEGGVRAA
jgi:hypothetical protein